jgi:hypothetical protein
MAEMVPPSGVTLIHMGAGSRADGHAHAIRGLDLLLEEEDPEARESVMPCRPPWRHRAGARGA